ncbi:MAG TPA: excinuclease ABC subunit UvrA, partial [Acidimicrobiales bacterium]|nr:excinuclease ABC subunit UvrA [Acidimicrobiales bacterium]
YDYLRLLYARVGVPHCPKDGSVVSRQTPQQIVDRVLTLPEGTRFQVLAPVVRGRKGEYESLFEELVSQGFARARIDGAVHELASVPKLARYEAHTIEVVIDRLVLRPGIERRLTDSLETALKLADGVAEVQIVPREGSSPSASAASADGTDAGPGPEGQELPETLTFSQHLACPVCGTSYDELAPRNFSFNSPYGACPKCDGLGTRYEVDPDLVVPDPDRSLAEGAVAPWAGARSEYFGRLLEGVAASSGISMSTPWRKLKKSEQKIVLYGSGKEQVHLHYRNRYGRTRSYYTTYEGVVPYLQRRHAEAESDTMREQIEGYMREVPCSECGGARLRPESRAVTIGDLGLVDLCRLSIRDATKVVGDLDLSERDHLIADRVLKEVRARLQFLVDVGLDYLCLNRSAGTLAGGEAQRIRLASQIGSGLVGVLYVLDEPSIGLHQRDNRKLIDTLVRLRDLGNTVIVVEHDEDTIRTADHVVDIGPGAGEHGGQVVVSGTVKDLLKSKTSLTGQYLSGKRFVPVPARRREPTGWLTVKGAREHNLKDVDARFPLGCVCVVTGVSGSGKSTLVNDILLRVMMQKVYKSKEVPGRHKRVEGTEAFDKVVDVDQSPIGRTPRSNPATYTGVFDHIRKLFATTTEAKVRGYQPGRFSFNVSGGRCEACSGDGTIKIEMHFLPDIYVPCEVCKGARYNRDTLDITFKGKNIAEVLGLSCEEAAEYFVNQPVIARHMQTLVDVGLGYVKLGQPAPTLSGGEAQRIKLASELSRRSTGRTLYVLDEPTTGLHFEDVRRLLGVLNRLADQGNTVIVIEHNLDVIKTGDWLIDLGPEGGDGGGAIVVSGTPEDVAKCPDSYTGQFLAPLLSGK